jgi:hypothetical protein
MTSQQQNTLSDGTSSHDSRIASGADTAGYSADLHHDPGRGNKWIYSSSTLPKNAGTVQQTGNNFRMRLLHKTILITNPQFVVLIALAALFLLLIKPVWTSSAQAQAPDPLTADTPWPMYQHDPQHTGRSPLLGPVHQPAGDEHGRERHLQGLCLRQPDLHRRLV